MQKNLIGNKWDELLADEWEKPYYQELREFLKREYSTGTVYPPAGDIYNALRLTDYDDVKVVILGQDPYHEPGQAHGMAFSVRYGTQEPPSLVNILKELEDDLGIVPSFRTSFRGGEGLEGNADLNGRLGEQNRAPGLLDPWARNGVLLLNTVLTVRAHQAASHKGRGWEQFTDRVIELLAMRSTPMVFLLWGAHAQAKKEIIRRAEAKTVATAARTGNEAKAVAGSTRTDSISAGGSDPEKTAGAAMRRHLIIEAPHPSPLSAYRGFFGGRYFSRCNYFLEDNGIEPVDWHL